MGISIHIGGSGFIGMLTLIFILLKLLKVINWSWWWVLSPIWIGAALFTIILAIFFIIWWRQNK